MKYTPPPIPGSIGEWVLTSTLADVRKMTACHTKHIEALHSRAQFLANGPHKPQPLSMDEVWAYIALHLSSPACGCPTLCPTTQTFNY
ncbi:hypothetical protein [Burkholderia thailandensis]|uniref:hypothetical protein n=1 Tax=Burkholderia thailandensis TaxID=57975 RepID=UPI00195995B6|nr:hypothetical protein [Burkholderia thailandensis]